MRGNTSAVAVCDSHIDLEKAVGELRRYGVEEERLSIIVREDAIGKEVAGYYHTGERTGYMDRLRDFWSSLRIFRTGSVLSSFVPGLGQVIVAGPMGSRITAALAENIATDALSAVGIALYSIGIPKEIVITYETFLKANKYLLVVHGMPEKVDRPHRILVDTNTDR